MQIYAKKGHGGKTSLYNGKRTLKYGIKVESYGTIDELNSMFSLAKNFIEDETTQFAEEQKYEY